MTPHRTTVRLPEELAARLRRAHYLTKQPQNDIIAQALDHWLVNPRKPGCGLRRIGESMKDTAVRVLDETAAEQ